MTTHAPIRAVGPPITRTDAGDAFAASADECDRLERELRTDPCNLVRRACQLADYEVAPPGLADEARGG